MGLKRAEPTNQCSKQPQLLFGPCKQKNIVRSQVHSVQMRKLLLPLQKNIWLVWSVSYLLYPQSHWKIWRYPIRKIFIYFSLRTRTEIITRKNLIFALNFYENDDADGLCTESFIIFFSCSQCELGKMIHLCDVT